MGKVLTVINKGDIQKFKPATSEFMKYDSVVCPNTLHFADDHVQYEEWLAKLTYCARQRVFLEMVVKEDVKNEHSFGDKPKRIGGYTPITFLRLSRRLADMGFTIEYIHHTGSNRMLVAAIRMQRIPYTTGMDFMAIREHMVVIGVPINIPMWDNLWPLIAKREPDYHSRVRDLRNEYKEWMDEPIWFALDKEHVVQGSHRLSLHKLMGRSTIDMRIMRTWWADDPEICKPGKIKEQLDYIHGI